MVTSSSTISFQLKGTAPFFCPNGHCSNRGEYPARGRNRMPAPLFAEGKAEKLSDAAVMAVMKRGRSLRPRSMTPELRDGDG
jgi:hypothetical protein